MVSWQNIGRNLVGYFFGLIGFIFLMLAMYAYGFGVKGIALVLFIIAAILIFFGWYLTQPKGEAIIQEPQEPNA